MKRRAFLGLAAASLALIACEQIIGIAGTQDRVATPVRVDAGDAGMTCTGNAQCIDLNAGKPSLCVASRCVPIREDLCVGQAFPVNQNQGPEALRNDNVLVIPVFLPLAGLSINPSFLAYNLALKELADGIPLNPQRRPLAMIVCDVGKDKAADGVKHVVNDLKLPALIAGFGADDLTAYVRDITKPANVFVLNPSVAPQLLKYDTNKRDYFWSLLGTTEDVALAYHPLVDRITKYLGKPKVKIALVHTKTPGETAAANVVHLGSYVSATAALDLNHAIKVNGVAPADAPNDFLYDPFEGNEQDQEIKIPDDLVSTIVNFEPDIVIALTAGEITKIVPDVDDQLAMKAGKRPMWILGQRNAHWPDLMTYMSKGSVKPPNEEADARPHRFVGIQYAGAEDNDKVGYNAWLDRMDAEYKAGGADPGADYSAAENFYDAIYWIAYGLYAGKSVESKSTDSDAIAQGVRRLVKGDPIGPGPGIGPAFSQLGDLTRSRVEGTYLGALGTPHIDEVSGVWRSTGSTYCYPTAGESDGGIAPRYDVQRYDAGSDDLVNQLFPDGNKKLCFTF